MLCFSLSGAGIIWNCKEYNQNIISMNNLTWGAINVYLPALALLLITPVGFMLLSGGCSVFLTCVNSATTAKLSFVESLLTEVWYLQPLFWLSGSCFWPFTCDDRPASLMPDVPYDMLMRNWQLHYNPAEQISLHSK